jgi:isochorismate hydrolase
MKRRRSKEQFQINPCYTCPLAFVQSSFLRDLGCYVIWLAISGFMHIFHQGHLKYVSKRSQMLVPRSRGEYKHSVLLPGTSGFLL